MSMAGEWLRTPRDLEDARQAASSTFARIDVVAPFTSELAHRTLIYPTDYTQLTRQQFAALASAAESAGDRLAFVAVRGGRTGTWQDTVDHRRVDLEDYESYVEPGNLVLEHILYSPRSLWGVVTSDARFAVAGGSEEFCELLRKGLPRGQEEMTEEFVRDQSELGAGGAAVDWVPVMLEHLYGASRVKTIWPPA